MSILVYVLALSIVSVSSLSNCVISYGNWTACNEDGVKQRTISCVCDGKSTDTAVCLTHRISLQPIAKDCDGDEEEQEGTEDITHSECEWKWTRWSRCTAPGGGGNTTRIQVCICEERDGPAPNEWCDAEEYYGNETCECNQYKCGSVPAFNKVYWMRELPDWPIDPQTRFNCSLGYDLNSTDTPKGKTFARVLTDPHPEQHPHFEWYYLAKEWIATRLNIANGVALPPSSLSVVNNVSRLLENCQDWPNHQKYVIFAGKEKLGRLNNNIGGLSNVDQQMAILADHSRSDSDTQSESSDNNGTLILTIIIPVVAALLIGVAVGLTVYYVKERKNAVVEQAAFESEDEPSDDDPVKKGDVPLENNDTQTVTVERQHHSDDSEDEQ